MKSVHRKVIQLQARFLKRVASEIKGNGKDSNHYKKLRGKNYDTDLARQLAITADAGLKAKIVRQIRRSPTIRACTSNCGRSGNRVYGNMFYVKAVIIKELIGNFNEHSIDIFSPTYVGPETSTYNNVRVYDSGYSLPLEITSPVKKVSPVDALEDFLVRKNVLSRKLGENEVLEIHDVIPDPEPKRTKTYPTGVWGGNGHTIHLPHDVFDRVMSDSNIEYEVEHDFY